MNSLTGYSHSYKSQFQNPPTPVSCVTHASLFGLHIASTGRKRSKVRGHSPPLLGNTTHITYRRAQQIRQVASDGLVCLLQLILVSVLTQNTSIGCVSQV